MKISSLSGEYRQHLKNVVLSMRILAGETGKNQLAPGLESIRGYPNCHVNVFPREFALDQKQAMDRNGGRKSELLFFYFSRRIPLRVYP